MPDSRTARGPHPKDRECFRPEALPALRAALFDLCWLRSRGYPASASLKLVGDRHLLRDRQRKAIQRCAAGDQERARRRRRRVDPRTLKGEVVELDGYNVLLTLEAALGGGVLLLARDGTLRDMAAMSGHYRCVDATRPALVLLARFLAGIQCGPVRWYLDRPVSNSGRLRALIQEVAGQEGWPWEVELVANPDALLVESPHVIATADSAVLDRCRGWLNLARLVVEELIPEAWVLRLDAGEG